MEALFKRNNISENQIRRREIAPSVCQWYYELPTDLKAVDHVNSEVRSDDNIFADCLCSFLDELSSFHFT